MGQLPLVSVRLKEHLLRIIKKFIGKHLFMYLVEP